MNKKIILLVGLIIVLSVAFGLNLTKNKTQTKNVSIAMVTFPGYGPLYIAKEKGFFGDLNVNLKRIESIGDIRAGVNSGNVDMYAATYDIYQSIMDQKPTGLGFVVIDESHGADGIVASKDIKSIADFRGKKIGAEPGFPPYLVLQYMLSKEGMTLKDVDFKDLPTTDAGNAFVANKLDIAAVYEPSLSASAKARPGSKIIATSADTKGLIQDLLFSNEKFAKENPDVLRKIAEGYFKAVEFIKTNPDESYSIMAKNFGVSIAEMKDFATGVSWPNKDENLALFNKESDVNVYKTFAAVGDLLEKNGETNVRVDAYEKLSNKFINK